MNDVMIREMSSEHTEIFCEGKKRHEISVIPFCIMYKILTSEYNNRKVMYDGKMIVLHNFHSVIVRRT